MMYSFNYFIKNAHHFCEIRFMLHLWVVFFLTTSPPLASSVVPISNFVGGVKVLGQVALVVDPSVFEVVCCPMDAISLVWHPFRTSYLASPFFSVLHLRIVVLFTTSPPPPPGPRLVFPSWVSLKASRCWIRWL